jgi:hypothetical protein
LVFEGLHESETFCLVGFEYEDCSTSTAACLVCLPDPSFRLPTWPVRLPPCAYKREVTPLQRDTTKTATTTYEISSWFQSLRHRSLPHPDLRCYEATLQIPETTFLPMRASLDPFFLQRSSSSRYDQVDQRLPMTMKMAAKGILKDHLVLVADSMMSTGIKKRFNNAGYMATL